MTVERYEKNNTHVFCTWFDAAHARHNDLFLEAMLASSSRVARPVVLVVEDDTEFRTVLREALEHQGCRVISVGQGDHALQILRNMTPPELVLLDLQMPVMDGWTFLEEQARDPALSRVPVVIITSSSNAVRQPLKQDVLLKPLDLEQLGTSIERYITHGS